MSVVSNVCFGHSSRTFMSRWCMYVIVLQHYAFSLLFLRVPTRPSPSMGFLFLSRSYAFSPSLSLVALCLGLPRPSGRFRLPRRHHHVSTTNNDTTQAHTAMTLRQAPAAFSLFGLCTLHGPMVGLHMVSASLSSHTSWPDGGLHMLSALTVLFEAGLFFL